MRGQKNDDVTRTDSAGVFADALGGETNDRMTPLFSIR